MCAHSPTNHRREDDAHHEAMAGAASAHDLARMGEGYDPTREDPRRVDYTPGFHGAGPSAPVPEVAFNTASGDVITLPHERRVYPSRVMIRGAKVNNLGDIRRVLLKAPWWDADGIRDSERVLSVGVRLVGS